MTRLNILCLLVVTACVGDELHGHDPAVHAWAQYGYDLRNSQHNPYETRLGAANVSQLHERWRLRVPGGATGTPVVADGQACFGAWNGHFYCVAADSGEIRWDRRLTSELIRSTALISGERVYVGAGAKLFALDRTTGETRFETLLDDHPTTGIDASPKRVDDLILIGIAHYENVTMDGGYTSRGALIALDADSGEEVWRVATTGDGPGPCTGGAGASIWSSVAIDPALGLAYVGTGQGFAAPASTCSDTLLAIHYRRDHSGERIAWRQQYTADDVYNVGPGIDGPDADIGSSPNLFEAAGRRLVGAGDKAGSYRVFDRENGEPVWRRDLQHGPPPVDSGVGGIMTTAAVGGDTVYLTSNVFAGLHWILEDVLDPADTAVLYALDSATGAERWSVALPAPVLGGLTLANGVLYQPGIDGQLFARDPASGAELARLQLGQSLGATPSVLDGRLYVSAGLVLNGAQDLKGGFIASFGVGSDPPSTIRDAAPDQLEPLDGPQCLAALSGVAEVTPACSSCLCACNASAAGHCEDGCLTLAPCTTMSCADAQPGDDMRACLRDACGAKLLPTYLFDRAVDVAPCVVQCASTCGL